MAEDAEEKPEVRKGHCPECGPDRFADVLGTHIRRQDDDEHGIWFREEFSILVCRGCETPYFQTTSLFSEDVDHFYNHVSGEWEQIVPETVRHFPSPIARPKPEWLIEISVADALLGSLLGDVYECLNAELSVPAAISMRTCFDRFSEIMGVDAGLSFAAKLKRLVDSGKISAEEKAILEVLTDAGSAAAHRAWRPNKSQLKTMMDIVEALLHRSIVLKEAAAELKKGVPPRPSSTGGKKK